MARRKTKRKRRRSNDVKLLNVLEAYAYATILTEGALGTSPFGFITGDTNLSSRAAGGSGALAGRDTSMIISGAGEISLGDLVKEPQLALDTIYGNVNSNWQAMAIQSVMVGIGFKFGKRLLRRPIANVNRNIMKPLGVGVKI